MKKKDPSSGFSTESKCASYAGFIKQFKKNSKINSVQLFLVKFPK